MSLSLSVSLQPNRDLTLQTMASLSDIRSASDNQLDAAEDNVLAASEGLLIEMNKHLDELEKGNTQLEKQIIDLNGSTKQLDLAHQALVKRLTEELMMAEKELASLRNEWPVAQAAETAAQTALAAANAAVVAANAAATAAENVEAGVETREAYMRRMVHGL